MKAKSSPQKRILVCLSTLPDTGNKPVDQKQDTITAAKGNPIMKGDTKKKSKPKNSASAEQPAEKPIESTSAEEMPGPSPAELALITAALKGRGDGPPDFAALASEALRLWQACKNEIRLNQIRLLPVPKQYPVSFDEFLMLVVPNKSTKDQYKAFRHFLMDWHRKKDITEVSELFIWYKNNPFTEMQQYQYIGTLFRAWVQANVSIQKKLNGAKRIKGLKAPSEMRFKYTEDDAHKERRAVIMAADANTDWIPV
jgi:hypothetical protein